MPHVLAVLSRYEYWCNKSHTCPPRWHDDLRGRFGHVEKSGVTEWFGHAALKAAAKIEKKKLTRN